MVLIKPLIGAAALLSGFATALPRPDSAVGGEVAVSAPNGTPITDTAELASQTAAEAAAAATSSSDSSSGYGSSGYGSSGSSSDCGSEGCGSESSSSSSDCGYSGCGDSTTSAMMSEMTSESMMMSESTSTMEMSTEESTSMAYSMPSYGSGGYNWQNSGYDDCVQQCIASYGAPPATYTPSTATYDSGSYGGSSGTGSTMTVIVAPTKGVFRYVPAFLNASVGTTIEFMWGADNHTVTKSSELLPCNHSAEEPSFISGVQLQGFKFTQVVNDTNPTFFYCGVPTHCQKGMFGVINPPSDFGSPMSVSGMMQGMMDNNSMLEAYAAYSANVTSGKAGANWGGSISLESMPSWSHELVAENVLYTRNLLAMNPEFVKEDGSIDMSTFGSMPLSIPSDYGAIINAASTGSGAGSSTDNTSTDSTSTDSGSTDSSSSSAPDSSSTGTSNGALSVTSSKMLVAAMALVATVFAL